jgi:hypothetical protein
VRHEAMQHDVVTAVLAAVQWCLVRCGILFLSIELTYKGWARGAPSKGLSFLRQTLAHEDVFAIVRLLSACLFVAFTASIISDVYGGGVSRILRYEWWTTSAPLADGTLWTSAPSAAEVQASAPTAAGVLASAPTVAEVQTSAPTVAEVWASSPTDATKEHPVLRSVTTSIFSAVATIVGAFARIGQFVHSVEAMLMQR